MDRLDKSALACIVLCAILEVILLFLLLSSSGCAATEFKIQHCARLCLDEHGPHRPDGVYSVRVRGDSCSCVLWDGREVRQGLMSKNWRPE